MTAPRGSLAATLPRVATPASRRFAAELLALRDDTNPPVSRQLRDVASVLVVPALAVAVLRVVDVLHPWAPIVTAAVTR